MKVALDRDAVRTFLRTAGGGHEREALADLLQLGATLHVAPVIVEEIDSEGDRREERWRETALQEIRSSEFLRGCAAGIARRYLDYYPDPRDCRLVAEAECAKMDVVVTLRDELIRGLGSRAEKIRIEKPADAIARLKA